MQDITSPMTPSEKRATMALAGTYALRMLGLFMILPVLSLFAEQLEGSTPALIGLAMSIYGLPQVLLQIPFGLLSDRFGRKKMIIIGLLLFLVGSVIAALSTTIYGILVGRAFQGAGAVSAVIMALVADLTQEVHRTKAMALIGISIGASFGVGIIAGPVISGFGGVQSVFWVTAILTALAILTIIYIVPDPQQSKLHRDAEVVPEDMLQVLKNPDLLRLNYGIFTLHLILMAIFVVVPSLMRNAGLLAGHEWQVYLPVFVISMAFAVPFVIIAEKKRKMKQVFIGAIAVVMLAELGLSAVHQNLFGIIGFLWLFFCGFNLLEATLPSLISKTAPADLKGTAMGAYSSCQFMGLFMGGLVGGWFNGAFGVTAVFLFCAAAASSWLLLSLWMKQPRYVANLLISLEQLGEQEAREFVADMLKIVGVVEITPHYQEAVAYLKVDNQQLDREQLQQLINQYAGL
ncbi:MAG: MFS transporter [Methylobacter sp.]|nr:MFS transporter [Methylobacter sp.]MDP2428864.1 MFS transporter [Methylobacter sp.]MDP3053333.1 MFS transporter [Methylobacter sp.]MDP3362093.1 MFS transporter [Methylobacter sp.]MDZ4218470.1 MFS transporter [Methylobacter sp.]